MNAVRYTYPNEPDMYYDHFHIKKKNGTYRSICAPSPALLAYQRERLPNLVHNFEIAAQGRNVAGVFHGFLPNKNCVTAARQHIGYDTTLIMDISNFFDSVYGTRGSARFRDSKFFTLHQKLNSAAQGFATSPIIANRHLIEPISRIKDSLEELLGRYSRDFIITVYADDIQISFNDTSYDTSDLIKMIVTENLNEHGFKVHPHKTRITYAKHGYRKILGIMVGDDYLKPTRKLKRKIRAARHQSNPHSLGGLVTSSRLLLPRSLR